MLGIGLSRVIDGVGEQLWDEVGPNGHRKGGAGSAALKQLRVVAYLEEGFKSKKSQLNLWFKF